MTLWEKLKVWRLRPGIAFAAKLADQCAWGHANARMLGPEQNLLRFSQSLNDRLLRADEGDPAGLYLNPVHPVGRAHGEEHPIGFIRWR